jgi:hypothetical protein
MFVGTVVVENERTAENLARVDALQFEVLDFDREDRAPGWRAARAPQPARRSAPTTC